MVFRDLTGFSVLAHDKVDHEIFFHSLYIALTENFSTTSILYLPGEFVRNPRQRTRADSRQRISTAQYWARKLRAFGLLSRTVLSLTAIDRHCYFSRLYFRFGLPIVTSRKYHPHCLILSNQSAARTEIIEMHYSLNKFLNKYDGWLLSFATLRSDALLSEVECVSE